MSTLSLRRLGTLCCLALFAFAPRLAAGLVWSPGTGWQAEGGIAAGLGGIDSVNALDLMNRARDAEEAGSLRRALKLYRSVEKDYTNSIYAPEALYRSAKVRLARRQYFKAFEAYQGAVSRYPSYDRFNEIVGEQYRIAAALLDGARNYLFGVIPSFKNRDRAILYFETVLFNAPYSDYAPLALMNIARAHQREGNDPEAIDALDRMINNYPQSLLAPDAYLRLAEVHASLVDGPLYDQASTKEAITYFEDFMILFPDDTSVGTAEDGLDTMKTTLAESKMRLGDYYFYKRDNYVAARVLYNEAITAYPDSAVAAKAAAQLALVDAARVAAESGDPAARRKFLGLF